MSENQTPNGTPMRELVAEEIRVLLARRKMSASELARRMGVTQPYISRRLTGDTPLDVDDMATIARVLGVTVGDLLPRSEEGRLITVGADAAGMGRITNARSTHPTDRAHLTGHPKRTSPNESTRRPARVHAPRTR